MATRESPLQETHIAAGASFTDFGGWTMPVDFGSVRTEHRAVREGVGRFDVSHMGTIEVGGPDAQALMNCLSTNDVTALDPGEAQYTMVTDADGVIRDDILVFRLPEDWETEYRFVPNAGHDELLTDWWIDHRDEWGLDATVRNETERDAMIAVQGPEAAGTLESVVESRQSPGDLERFGCRTVEIAGARCLLSRTGYTGEDGFELCCSTGQASEVWNAFDCQPCGLGARDTLRLEMGYLLSGSEFHHEANPRTPFEAGVGFTVDLDTEFVGRDALRTLEDAGVAETLVGFTLTERGIPREGYEIRDEHAKPIGAVTSGTMSPTLGEPIGLGYVPVEYASAGTPLSIVVRGERKSATVVTVPFLPE